MKIVIIEDEWLVAEDLSASLKQIRPGINIECILGSVKEAVDYFKQSPQPDLIFSDIQLGDGLSFEIAQSIDINVPIIFCTAYDDYAIDAFKVNGIEYILKPFSTDSLEKAISKFENLKKLLTGNIVHQYEAAMQALSSYQLKDNGTYIWLNTGIAFCRSVLIRLPCFTWKMKSIISIPTPAKHIQFPKTWKNLKDG